MHGGKSTGGISLDADASGLINDALTEVKHVCNANVGVALEVVIRPNEDIDEEGRRGGGGVIATIFGRPQSYARGCITQLLRSRRMP